MEVEPFDNIEVYNLICGKYIYINSTAKCGYPSKNMYFEIDNKLNPRGGGSALRRK